MPQQELESSLRPSKPRLPSKQPLSLFYPVCAVYKLLARKAWYKLDPYLHARLPTP
jgi:hypothetical protein